MPRMCTFPTTCTSRPLLTNPILPQCAEFRAYPAHLHIDLLPRAQGRGLGRRMIATLLGALHARGVGGVHLEMSAFNERALGFYQHLGFHVLGRERDNLYLGISTSPS